MSKRWFAAAAAVLIAAPVYAQGTVDPQCPPGSSTLGVPNSTKAVQDVCQKTIDLFQYMAPELGISLTGGNVVLGQGGTLGGLGHFALELKGNIVAGTLPEVDKVTPSPDGAVASPYTTKNQVLGLPAVTAAIGIFKGLPLGLTNVGGIDALVSATYVPTVGDSAKDAIYIKPKTNTQFGYGVRVGLLQESLVVPGVGFSWIKRDLPKTSIYGKTTQGGQDAQLTIRDLDEKTSAWRLTASKNLLLFSLAAGLGQDKYDATTGIDASFNGTSGGVPVSGQTSVTTSQKMTRTNYFLDASMNLVLFKLTGEVGQVSGGTVSTYNTFDKKPDASRFYGSVGLRFGF